MPLDCPTYFFQNWESISLPIHLHFEEVTPMKKLSCFMMLGAVFGLLVLSCENAPNPTAVPLSENPSGALSKNNVIHHVSVGGSDICVAFGLKSGCDGNFSLVANMKADGSVKGQYTDQFGHGNGGFHATVTCLSVNGNEAWVSGVITSGNFQGFDLTGLPVITKVMDNGTSGDQISFSFIGDPTSCSDQPDFPLLDMTGQVTVW
jgi:hypothetical protein